MRIVKTYALGRPFNIIFSCAQSTLQDYLRNEGPGAHLVHFKREIWSHPFWNQMIGSESLEELEEIHSIDCQKVDFRSKKVQVFSLTDEGLKKDFAGILVFRKEGVPRVFRMAGRRL